MANVDMICSRALIFSLFGLNQSNWLASIFLLKNSFYMDPMELSSGYKQAGLILCSPNTINCTNFTNKNIMESSSENKISIWKLKYSKKPHLFQFYFVFYSYFLTFHQLSFVSNSSAYVKGK